MAKKNFDDFIESVEKPRKMTAEEAAKLVALVHEEENPTQPAPVKKKQPGGPKPDKIVSVPTHHHPQRMAKTAAGLTRRGRPSVLRDDTERLYRLSVDLPGSLLLSLKGAAMNDGTDMKNYVRDLIERHLTVK